MQEEAQALLPGQYGPDERISDEMKANTLGRLRAYWLGSVICLGGFLFGYDSGIVGGVLTLDSFRHDFHYGSSEGTRTNSLSVGLQQLGAFVACFATWPLTDKIGRKKALMLASGVFIIGAVIQTVNTHSLTAFYIARVIAGLGLGAATVVIPMFNSEMMPRQMRGQVGSFFQWFYTFGIFVSYFIDYGVGKDMSSRTAQWQIPIGLQIFPAAVLGLGMFTVPDSTRWLTKKGRHEEALKSLQWIRADTSETTELEMAEIRAGVEADAVATEGFEFKELLQADNFKRILAAFAVFTAQQATGATAFAYFGPQYFALIVGSSGQRSLLVTAIFGAVKVVACGVFVLWFSERLSRRQVLIGGAVFMCACQVTTAVVVKEFPAPEGQGASVESSAIATIALIYLFVVAYNFSWGPMPWPYVSEIFSARIREPGIAIGVASQWLWNFVFSLTTPYMINSLGWGTFLLWGLFDLVIAIATFLFLKETRGLSLEHIAQSSYKKADDISSVGSGKD